MPSKLAGGGGGEGRGEGVFWCLAFLFKAIV